MEFRACRRRQRGLWTSVVLPGLMLRGRVTYQLLKEVTDNFSKEREIGAGASGKVFKGVTKYGKEVAVKLLQQTPLSLDDHQFENELKCLMFLKHQNIVSILGYCNETQENIVEHKGKLVLAETTHRALCFQYLENGNLQRHLSDESCGLDWNTRYKIIKGTCDGLKYIYNGLGCPLYHLDLKPENILLDKNMVPKVADFGISKMFNHDKSRCTLNKYGTLGYIPPEYIDENIISDKFDIYSLGVVMIKIVRGPRAYYGSSDISNQSFIDQAQQNWRKRLQKQCTGSLLDAYCQQVKVCTELALNCVEKDRHKRPDIGIIIDKLRATEKLIDKTKRDLLEKAVKDTVEVIRRGSTKLHPLSRLAGDATERMSQLYCLFNTKETIIAREVFNFFDVNRDGFIDAVDLQVVLERLGIPQGAEECRAMIVMAIPTNMMLLDGKMNLTQFTQFFLTAWAEPPPRRY